MTRKKSSCTYSTERKQDINHRDNPRDDHHDIALSIPVCSLKGSSLGDRDGITRQEKGNKIESINEGHG